MAKAQTGLSAEAGTSCIGTFVRNVVAPPALERSRADYKQLHSTKQVHSPR